jgi:hypothetical protein
MGMGWTKRPVFGGHPRGRASPVKSLGRYEAAHIHTISMKTSMLFAVAVFFGFEHARAAEATAASRDLTRGNVRAVLMSVSQTTVFPNAADKGNTHRGTNDSVPCFTVTVLVEALGNKPFQRTSGLQVRAVSGGKPLIVSQSSYQHDFDYHAFQEFLDFTRPKVSNPKRAFIRRHVEFGAVSNLDPFDLVIETGFDQDVQKFEFKGVSLKGAGSAAASIGTNSSFSVRAAGAPPLSYQWKLRQTNAPTGEKTN